jgi:hypothetical protein
VTVNKRRLRLRFLNGRLHTKVDLRRPGTTFRVRIVLRTRGGRRAVRVKTFRTCARA